MEKATKNSKADSRHRKNSNLKAQFDAALDSATSLDELFKALGKMEQSEEFEDVVTQTLLQYQKIPGFDSKGRKIKGNAAKLKQAFTCSKSAAEKLKTFRKMESHFDDKDLGYELWELTVQLHEERQDQHTENILCYGKRALKFAVDGNNFFTTHGSSFMVPSTLNSLGYACCKLNRYPESLGYLNWSERNLSMMESCPADFVLRCLRDTHFELAMVKTAMGKGEEIVIHMRKILEIQEKGKMGCSIDQAVEEVVDALKGWGLREQNKVDGAVRLLREMKESAGGGDFPKKTSKCGVQDGIA